MRIILSIASAFALDVWSLHIIEVCTRSEPTRLLVFIKLDLLSGILPSRVFQIVRPLYWLANTTEACWKTLKEFLTVQLGLSQCLTDPCLFFVRGSRLLALVGVYFVDLLLA